MISFFPISAELERLEEMYIYTDISEDEAQSLKTLFKVELYPPRLKKLHINEQSPNIFDFAPNITRAGLEELHIYTSDYSTPYLHRLLSPPNTIRRLEITTEDLSADGLAPLPPIACPAVRSLTLHEDLLYLFTNSAASVEELTLIDVNDPLSWSDSMLVAGTVWPTLRTVRTTAPHHVRNTPTVSSSLSNPFLQSILTHHPSVTTLTFLQLTHDIAGFIDFLDKLESSGVSIVTAPSFPSLRHLNFEFAKSATMADVQRGQAVVTQRNLHRLFPMAEFTVFKHTCVEYIEECVCQ